MPIKNSSTRLVTQNAGGGKPAAAAFASNADRTVSTDTRLSPVFSNNVGHIFTDSEKEEINNKDESRQKRKKSTNVNSYKRENREDTGKNQTGETFTKRESRTERSGIVYTFAPTDYDTYLTGSGVNSYQPLIIADVPFMNYFDSESPTYDIVRLQQDLQDKTIKTANNLIREFYRSNPNKKRTLEQMRDKNLAFYNTAVPALTDITLASRALNIDLGSTSYGSGDYQSVDVNFAQRIKYNGNSINNTYIAYSEDDVLKASQIIGAGLSVIISSGDLYKSTVLGQLAHDKVGKLIYGVGLNSFGDTIISPDTIRNNTARETSGFGIYKHVLTRAAFAWQKGGFINNQDYYEFVTPEDADNSYRDDGLAGRDVYDLYSNQTYSISYDYSLDSKGFVELIGGFHSIDNPNKPYGIRGVVPKFRSTVQERAGITYDSAVPILITAHLINEQIAGPLINNTTLPGFMRSIGVGPIAYTLQQTATEAKFPLAATIGSKTYSLFDSIISNEDVTSSTSIHGLLAATTFDIDELTTLRDKLINSRNSLDRMISDNTGYLGSFMARVLLKAMFEEYYDFFNNSVLTTSSSRYSLARTALFLAAASDENLTGLVWAMCNNKQKIREAQDLYYFEEAIDSSAASFNDEYSNPGVFTFGSYSDTVEETRGDAEDKADSSRVFLEKMFATDSSFGMFDRIAEKVIDQFPQINNTVAEGAIKLTSFVVFLDILRLLKTKSKVHFVQAKSGNYNGIEGYVKFSKRDTTAVTDCLRSALLTSDLNDFTTYSNNRNGITESTKEKIRTHFWPKIRGIVRDVLQPYESFVGTMAYVRTLLSSAILDINVAIESFGKIITGYQNLDGLSNAESRTKAKLLISKYGTPESIVELQNRSQRYKNLIGGTDIVSMATRSGYFRSIVEAAHRDVLTERQAKIYVIGLPYGMLENLRLSQPVSQTATPQFNVHINKVDDEGNRQRVDYYLPQDTLTGSLGYAYSTSAMQINDSQETSRITNFTDPNLKVDFFDFDTKIYRSISAATRGRTASLESQKVQSSLESYIEDLYGLYPRYAFVKDAAIRPVSEEEIATEVSNNFSVDEQEAQLIRSRLRSAIMMHKDFCTTTMLNDLETSPLFDRIVYCLVETETAGNLVSLTAKVQV